jgi:hypothetical protein
VAPGGEIATPVLLAGERAWSAAVNIGAQQTTVRWRGSFSRADPAGADAGAANQPGQAAGDATARDEDAAPAAGSIAGGGEITSVAAAGDAAAARATVAAANRWVALPRDTRPRPVTVVWPGAPERAELQAAAGPVSEPWMADALAALPDDQPLTAGSRDGRLLLFAGVEPGGARAAALIAALRGAATDLRQLDELEPESIAMTTLRGWERSVNARPVAAGSDARGVWLLVLALLLIEQVVRRRGRAGRQQSAAPAGGTGGQDVD